MHQSDLDHKPAYRDSGTAGGLRFINRHGKRILQQAWHFIDYDMRSQAIGGSDEWRDVPYLPNAEQGDLTVHP